MSNPTKIATKAAGKVFSSADFASGVGEGEYERDLAMRLLSPDLSSRRRRGRRDNSQTLYTYGVRRSGSAVVNKVLNNVFAFDALLRTRGNLISMH